MYPHAQESTADVLGAIGLTYADLYDEPVTRYVYPDGRVVVREPGRDAVVNGKRRKHIRQENSKGKRALYRSDRVTDTSADIEVFVVEGEPDVHAIETSGGIAVTSAGGSGKSRLFDWTPLRGRSVVIVADNDEPGDIHARQVAEQLAGVASSVRVVRAKIGKDASDHIAAGCRLDEFVTLAARVEQARPRRWRASELSGVQQPKWLARNRIPRAAITILVGDEGIGKSLFWVLVAYSVTTGKPLPEFGIPAREPEHVIVVATEDDWASTVLPRLQVAGVDLAMVSVICTDSDGSGAPVFPDDMDLIIDTEPLPGLVVVDAWLDTVPAGLSVRDPQQARQALHPWKEAANRTGAAVLLLTHTNRVSTGNARDKYGATAELRKKARMTLFAQADTEHEGQLLIGPEKANSTGGVEASRFDIESVQHFPANDDSDGTVPKLRLVGDSGQTMRQHIADAHEEVNGSGSSDRKPVIDWLERFLGQGSCKSTDLYSAADANGYSKDQIKRAKAQINATAGYERVNVYQQVKPGSWYWTLQTVSAAQRAPQSLGREQETVS